MQHGKLKQARPKRVNPESGVDFHNSSKKFRARISVLGSRYEIGFFSSRNEAVEAVAHARRWIEVFGKSRFATEFKPK